MLDALPGEVRSGERNRRDHPSDLISTLKTLELPITARSALIDRLLQAGFSQQVSSWMTTNLRPTNNRTKPQELLWSFDLDGVEEMYRWWLNLHIVGYGGLDFRFIVIYENSVACVRSKIRVANNWLGH